MENHIHAFEAILDALFVRYIRLHFGEIWILACIGKILGFPRAVVIDARHRQTELEKAIDQMTSDEARAAGDDCPWVCCFQNRKVDHFRGMLKLRGKWHSEMMLASCQGIVSVNGGDR
jgi:hypothetical protein